METPEVVAPLDCYKTAKPDEPVFTLQGGDPLAAPIVRIWALFAREAAGVIDSKLRSEILATRIERVDSKRERDDLLLRATQAEEVSWDMDDYLKQQSGAEEAKTPAENSLDTKAQLDLHDARLHAVSQLNNCIFEVNEIIENLLPSWPEDTKVIAAHLRDVVAGLELSRSWIKPSRARD